MSALRLTLGIDPGQTGCVAVLADGEFEQVVDLPVSARSAGGHEINGAELAAALREIRTRHAGAHVLACLEQVHAMPGQGVSSMFRFGEGFGVIKGVLAALSIPTVLVPPPRWKKHCGLIGADKDVARTVAVRRYPAAAAHLKRKKDVGRADALLIAQWAWMTEQAAQVPRAA